MRVIAQDLFRLCEGDPRAVPMLGCADGIPCAPPRAPGGPVRISHSPSARHKKGTDVILTGSESVAWASANVSRDAIGRRWWEMLRRAEC